MLNKTLENGAKVGYHAFGSLGDSGLFFIYWPYNASRREIGRAIKSEGVETRGRDCGPHAGDCCGRVFSYRAKLKRSKNRTLLTQYQGVDC